MRLYLSERPKKKGEKWTDVSGYEGLYQVSTRGRVWSVQRVRRFWRKDYARWVESPVGGHLLSPIPDQDGYKRVGLCKNGRMKLIGVHRLMALAFLPNPDNKPEVNHKDGLKWNNTIGNIEWATDLENSSHAKVSGLLNPKFAEEHPHVKLTSKQVKEIKKVWGLPPGKRPTQKIMARRYGVTQSRISLIVTGKSRLRG